MKIDRTTNRRTIQLWIIELGFVAIAGTAPLWSTSDSLSSVLYILLGIWTAFMCATTAYMCYALSRPTAVDTVLALGQQMSTGVMPLYGIFNRIAAVLLPIAMAIAGNVIYAVVWAVLTFTIFFIHEMCIRVYRAHRITQGYKT